MVLAGVEMIEDPGVASMTIEAHDVVETMIVVHAEALMMTVVHAGASMTTAGLEGEGMTTADPGVALMMTVVPGVDLMMTVARAEALMMTEVLVEAWMTRGAPGAGLMMTGAEEVEMMIAAEGEAWMMAHAVVKTSNPGNPWVDLVVGVSGRRQEKRAGDPPAMTAMKTETMAKTMRDQVTASDALKERRLTGGEEEEEVQRIQGPGETLVETTMIAMIVVTVTTAVIAVTESAGMTVNKEVHPENSRMTVVHGVVEVMIGERSQGNDPEKKSGSGIVTLVMLKEKRVGALTKKTLVAPRTRQMMTAGPPSAAEQETKESNRLVIHSDEFMVTSF